MPTARPQRIEPQRFEASGSYPQRPEPMAAERNWFDAPQGEPQRMPDSARMSDSARTPDPSRMPEPQRHPESIWDEPDELAEGPELRPIMVPLADLTAESAGQQPELVPIFQKLPDPPVTIRRRRLTKRSQQEPEQPDTRQQPVSPYDPVPAYDPLALDQPAVVDPPRGAPPGFVQTIGEPGRQAGELQTGGFQRQDKRQDTGGHSTGSYPTGDSATGGFRRHETGEFQRGEGSAFDTGGFRPAESGFRAADGGFQRAETAVPRQDRQRSEPPYPGHDSTYGGDEPPYMLMQPEPDDHRFGGDYSTEPAYDRGPEFRRDDTEFGRRSGPPMQRSEPELSEPARSTRGPLGGGLAAQRQRGRTGANPVVPPPRRGGTGASPLGRSRTWTIVLTAIAVVAVLAVCGLGSYFVFKNDGKTGGAGDGKPSGRDISNQTVDPTPLTEDEVFPAAELKPVATEQPYTVLKHETVTDCTKAATDEIAKLLTDAGCTQVVRATLKHPTGNYLVTAGLINLRDAATAQQAHTDIRTQVDAQTKGRFNGLIAGQGTDAIVKAPTQLGWNIRGHYLAYCVIARTDAAAFAADDAYPKQIIYDVVGTYLLDTVVAAREDPNGKRPSAPAAGQSPAASPAQ